MKNTKQYLLEILEGPDEKLSILDISQAIILLFIIIITCAYLLGINFPLEAYFALIGALFGNNAANAIRQYPKNNLNLSTIEDTSTNKKDEAILK